MIVAGIGVEGETIIEVSNRHNRHYFYLSQFIQSAAGTSDYIVTNYHIN
jgi:hypothetical protein